MDPDLQSNKTLNWAYVSICPNSNALVVQKKEGSNPWNPHSPLDPPLMCIWHTIYSSILDRFFFVQEFSSFSFLQKTQAFTMALTIAVLGYFAMLYVSHILNLKMHTSTYLKSNCLCIQCQSTNYKQYSDYERR